MTKRDVAPASVQSVDRALEVLEILGREGEGGVSDIADALGVHKSTVSRLVSVLESRGFVEQVSDRGKYRLGFTVVRLAGASMSRRDLGRESRDICEPLADAVGETVNLAVLDAGRAVNVTRRTVVRGSRCAPSSARAVRRTRPPAGRCCSPGLPEHRLAPYLAVDLERFTRRRS